MPIQVRMAFCHPWGVAVVAVSLCWRCGAAGALPLPDAPVIIDEAMVNDFDAFLRASGKAYPEKQSYDQRLKIYSQNHAFIDAFNMKKPSNGLRLGINQFADLTKEEFKRAYLSSLPKDLTPINGNFKANVHGLPDTVDWRTKGAVTSVKDQKSCGSCWAFSTTGAIEGAWFLTNGSLINLSTQELVDCSGGSCAGGKPVTALKWVAEHGICTEKSYPYTAFGDECHNQFWPCQKAAYISGHTDVEPNNEMALKAAVAQQPVSVLIEADTDVFRFYKSGVLKDSDCGNFLDHAVLAVGYDTDEGQPYWLVKNSWNVSWGDHGYVKLARTDSTASAGECGIAMQPVFPVIESSTLVV